MAFKLDASYSFINASCVVDLGLEVEAFRETRCGCFSLGCRVKVDRIGQDCELEISKILLRVDPREWVVTVWHHCVHVHGNITSSRAWVHNSGHSPLLVSVGCVRVEKFQFLEKGQNRNFGYKILISVKNSEFIL